MDHRASRSSPHGAFWRWADGRQSENFGLVRHPQSDDFCFIQITDTHIGNAEALRQFAKQTAKLPIPIAFVVNTGDMVRDSMGADLKEARRLFDRYMEAASAFEQPQFNVPGNHDHAAIGVKTVDRNDPLWGKGLYRHLFGPTHYSWDWGNVHFVALDGTSFPPYEEKLGAEQLAWLKADLSFQPHDKPLVLFCHEPVVATKNASGGLKDSEQLAGVLQGRKVLGIFCGHLHLTFTSTRLGEFPVYQTGAFCGGGDPDQWVWGGPNSDGSPQGFRLIQIKNGQMKTAYSNREGHYPLYVSSPLAPLKSHTAQSGKMEIEVVAMDFGKPVEVTAQYDDQPVPLKMVSREELWSTWKGTVDTSLAYDGEHVVHVSSRLGDDVSTCDMHYLVLNGRAQPYRADAPARLTFQVYRVHAAEENFFNNKPLGTVAANTPDKTVVSFDIPSDRLAKVNRVTVRAGGPSG